MANFIQVSQICILVYFTFTSQILLHNSQVLSLGVLTAYCKVLKCWAKRHSINLACWQMSWLGQLDYLPGITLSNWKILNSGDYSVLNTYLFGSIKKHLGLICQIHFYSHTGHFVWLYWGTDLSYCQHVNMLVFSRCNATHHLSLVC